MNVISKVSEIYIYQSLTQGVGHHFDFLLFLFPGIVGILPDGKFPLGEYIGLNPALNLVGHTWTRPAVGLASRDSHALYIAYGPYSATCGALLTSRRSELISSVIIVSI